ncbi:MAG: hypothetical protein AMJ93_11650 [Anaerolineae bacterium SM23_84]|nr:MAG: hypothetical protein AMJ93_11650 [Anaerolineae bacterium SM23_84]
MSYAGTVLVVDDDPDFVEYTRIVLESQRYQVKSAATADLALRMMRENKPDVVLLDVMMSYVLDGLNVTRQMRDDPELRDVPVIMISAIVSREEAGIFPTDQYLSVDTFMTKPVDPADLLEQIGKLIQRRSSGETEKPAQETAEQSPRLEDGGKKEE